MKTFCFECACLRCLQEDPERETKESKEREEDAKGLHPNEAVPRALSSGYSFFLRNKVLADTLSSEALTAKEEPALKQAATEAEIRTKRETWCYPAPAKESLESGLAALQLEVKPSLLPGAGQGLFTTVRRAKGSKVCVYEGTVLDTASALALSRKDYLMRLGPEVYVDARLHPRLPARYINDARDPEGVARVVLWGAAVFRTPCNRCACQPLRPHRRAPICLHVRVESPWNRACPQDSRILVRPVGSSRVFPA